MNIILTGMPGSGKSTVAPVLAARLGMNSCDTDDMIEKKYGPVSAIFAKYGEAGFRKTESEIISSLSGIKNTVVSTGGGCVLDPRNVKIFKEIGITVFLKAEAETLFNRLKGCKDRPLLSGGRDKLYSLFAARAPLYASAADITVETDGLTAEAVALRITEMLK